MKEGPLTMVMHGAFVTLVLYLIMKFVFRQSDKKALNRSVLMGLFIAAYMIIFGHNLPGKINSDLM